MAIFPGSAIPSGLTDYTIDQSLRIDGDGAALTWPPRVSGNTTTWTISMWVKCSVVPKGAETASNGNSLGMFSGSDDGGGGGAGWTDSCVIMADDNDKFYLDWFISQSGALAGRLITTRKFRDPASWMHLVFIWDTTNSTSGDRMQIWVNGVRETAFSTETQPSQDTPSLFMNVGGKDQVIGNYGYHLPVGQFPANSYFADVHFIDGQALDSSYFGEEDSDTGQWKPIEVTDMDYGVNGYYQKYNNTALADSFTDSAEGYTINTHGNVHTDTSVKKIGTASAEFDGTDDYISIEPSSRFEFSATDSFTLEGWVRFKSIPGSGPYYMFSLAGIRVSWDQNYDNWYCVAGSNDGTWSNTPSVDTWYHLAIVGDGTNVKLYIDGTERISFAQAGTVGSSTATAYFGTYDGNLFDFDGYIDEVRLSSSARYTGSFTPSTTAFTTDANTLLLLHMDGSDSGTVFTDSSETTGARHTITAEGGATNQRQQPHGITANGNASMLGPKQGTSIISMDGSGDYLEVPDSSDWDFGSNPWTVEGWFNISSWTDSAFIWNHYEDSDNFLGIRVLSGGDLNILARTTAGFTQNIDFTSVDLPTNVWVHLAVVRDTSAGNFVIYKDGVSVGSSSDGTAMADVTGTSRINDSRRYGAELEGYIDSFRVSNSARYTEAFTPPTSAFSNDGNTKLLIQSGTDGSQTFDDLSTPDHTITAGGDVRWFAPKIGAGAMTFDGSGDYLSTASSPDFSFGSGDFTLEGWVKLNSTGDQYFLSSHGSVAASREFYFGLESSTLMFYYYYGSSSESSVSSSWTPSANTWYHVAVCRNGADLRLFVDGSQLGSTHDISTRYLHNNVYDLLVGALTNTGGSITGSVDGYMDEVRISSTARYTTTFTPSTSEFTDDINTVLLIHADKTDGTAFQDKSTGFAISENSRMVFDGSDDWLKVPASTDWNIAASNSESFTLECWVKHDAHAGQETYFSQANGGDIWRFRNHHGTGLSFQVMESSSTEILVTGGEIEDTAWHHVALVKQGNTSDSIYTLYKDGVNVGSVTDSDTFTQSRWLGIGGNSDGGDYLDGNMDEIRVSDIARYPAFTPTENITADFLVIGGGGGGGSGDRSGGGGAGGYRTSVGTSGGGGSAESSLSLVADTTYAVSVGVGGGASASGAPSYIVGSSIDVTSKGGGKGGVCGGAAPASGGSGGGGGAGSTGSGAGASGTSVQGYAGGDGATTSGGNDVSGGGGGGAGAVGADVSDTGGGSYDAGDGGAGVSSSITGSAVTRAGGGGGGAWNNTGGTGGSGGGGAGGRSGVAGTAGTANTGGGGGGGGTAPAAGGSGVVIIRYVGTSPKATGGAITSYADGGTTYQVHTFTTSTGFTPKSRGEQFTADDNTKLLIHSDWDGGLGADSSGNHNTFAATNLVSTDQMKDSPTNNFATLNPIYEDSSAPPANVAFAQGNLSFTGTSGNFGVAYGTIPIPASGKWYWEAYLEDGDVCGVGIVTASGRENVNNGWGMGAVTTAQGFTTQDTYVRNSESNTLTLGTGTPSNGDIYQLAIDADNNKVWIGLDNTWNDSSGGTTGNPGSGANHTIALTFGSDAQIGFQRTSSSPNTGMVVNFGADSSFAGNKTAQGNADGNGVGDFFYEPPSGFLALCSDNLPDPSIADPAVHFNTILYTGTGSAQSVTGVGFSPDMVWNKSRSAVLEHHLFDTVRGATKYFSVGQADAGATDANSLTSFDSDGFSLGSSATDNQTSGLMVSWNWKGGGTAVSNDDGDITSSVSANTTAGFSIVSYAGSGSAGDTVGHGLSQTPDLIIIKNRSAITNWVVNSPLIDSTFVKWAMKLDLAEAISADTTIWNSTAPGASVFTLGTAGESNRNNPDNYMAYCFHSVEGYSKVGTYTGNGDNNGTFVYTGFRPMWVMAKCTDGSGSWLMTDSVRFPYNVTDDPLFADESSAETNSSTYAIDILSNGFKCRGVNNDTNNSSGNAYLYLSFAETPFKTSNAR